MGFRQLHLPHDKGAHKGRPYARAISWIRFAFIYTADRVPLHEGRFPVGATLVVAPSTHHINGTMSVR